MSRKLTTEEFIENARAVHGDKYDYSKVEYKGNAIKVCIICPEHGEFWQTPANHCIGKGCLMCGGAKKRTTAEFIEAAKKVHGDKYDYSKVNYINNNIKVIIICPIHGEFEQKPGNHLMGNGCPECGKHISIDNVLRFGKVLYDDKYDYSLYETNMMNNKHAIICPIHGVFFETSKRHINGCGCPKCKELLSPHEVFIKKAKHVHHNKYDYSKVEYNNSTSKVCVICPDHGEFLVTPNQHLSGSGCSKCAGVYSPTKDEFINRAQEVHNNKYDYSKVEYVNNKTKVCIICPKHGEFWQTPDSHLSGRGCDACRSKLTEEFIEQVKLVHGNKYDYSKTEYITRRHFITILCPEHGEFEQLAASHLSGNGCPKCSLKSQTKFYNMLVKHFPDINIIYEAKGIEWLSPRRFDIYFPDQNIAVEYNGIQHYQPVETFGGEVRFEEQQKCDNNKREKCKTNDCKLFEVPYNYTQDDFEELVTTLKSIIYGTEEN